MTSGSFAHQTTGPVPMDVDQTRAVSGTYRALCGFSAHLSLTILASASLSYTSEKTRLSLMLLSSVALVTASDSSGVFFQQAM